MTPAPQVPIPCRIVALLQEQNRLFAYPQEELADAIRSAGFRCTGCGTCCTQAVNSHIFLLDRDVDAVAALDSGAYVPAPDPEFCDQNGILYVSGYALRMKDDGSCWFLDGRRCRIYDRRFSGCRIYPHMLRRGAGNGGTVAWRRFAHPGEHGRRDPGLTREECLDIAREVFEYENAFLTQQITFLEAVHEYFTVHGLRHDSAAYARSMEKFHSGKPVTVMTYHAGEMHGHRYLLTSGGYSP